MAKTTKQRIVSAAISSTAKLGFRRTNARAVANLLGIQPSNVFYYFKTERDLTMAMVQQILQSNFSVVSKVYEDLQPDTWHDKIQCYLRGNLKWATSYSEQVSVLAFGMCEGRSDPNLLNLVRLALNDGEDKVYSMLVAGIAEGEFALRIDLAPREAAQAIHQALIGHILRTADDGKDSGSFVRMLAILDVFLCELEKP